MRFHTVMRVAYMPCSHDSGGNELSCSVPLLVQVHGAVCEKEGYKMFQDVTLDGHWTGWSGFRDTFDQHHAHQVTTYCCCPQICRGNHGCAHLICGQTVAAAQPEVHTYLWQVAQSTFIVSESIRTLWCRWMPMCAATRGGRPQITRCTASGAETTEPWT